MRGCHSSARRLLLQCGDNINEENREHLYQLKTEFDQSALSDRDDAVCRGVGVRPRHPLDKAAVVAQAPPQSEQEDKKQPPQRPGQREKQQEERREAPKPPPGAQPPGRPQERQVQPPPTPGEQPPGRRQERQVQPPPTPGEQPPGRRQERQVQPPPTPGAGVRNAAGAVRRAGTSGAAATTPGAQPPGRPQERQVQPPHRVRSRRVVRKNVRCNRRRARSLQAVRRNIKCSRHLHRVRSRRDLRQALSSRVSAVPAAKPGSHHVPLRHNSRSGRLRSLPRRCSHRPRRLDPLRRKRNAPSCRRRRRTVRDALTMCAAPAGRCARAIAS